MALASGIGLHAQFGRTQPPKRHPWSDASLSPDVRAGYGRKGNDARREDRDGARAGMGGDAHAAGAGRNKKFANTITAVSRLGMPPLMMTGSVEAFPGSAARGAMPRRFLGGGDGGCVGSDAFV